MEVGVGTSTHIVIVTNRVLPAVQSRMDCSMMTSQPATEIELITPPCFSQTVGAVGAKRTRQVLMLIIGQGEILPDMQFSFLRRLGHLSLTAIEVFTYIVGFTGSGYQAHIPWNAYDVVSARQQGVAYTPAYTRSSNKARYQSYKVICSVWVDHVSETP